MGRAAYLGRGLLGDAVEGVLQTVVGVFPDILGALLGVRVVKGSIGAVGLYKVEVVRRAGGYSCEAGAIVRDASAAELPEMTDRHQTYSFAHSSANSPVAVLTEVR